MSSYQVYFFYEEINSSTRPPISATTRKLFLDLAGTIAQALKVFYCYVCKTLVWKINSLKARKFDPLKSYEKKKQYPHSATIIWLFKITVTEGNCSEQWRKTQHFC